MGLEMGEDANGVTKLAILNLFLVFVFLPNSVSTLRGSYGRS